MNDPLLEKMGGERVCRICGYIEREVYRLFCPRCMQRDRLSTLVAGDNPRWTPSLPKDPSADKPVQGVSI